jgi:hypothetical protein
MITGMAKHFMFHILWISILRFLYFNFFSSSFCITFLSDGIATSINKQVLSFLFWLLCQACLPKPLYPFVSLDSIKQLHLHVQLLAYVCGSTSFMLFQFLISCILSSADVYILYHVLCIHSLPEWDILILGGQLSLHIVCTSGTYFQCLVSNFFLKVIWTNCLVLSCHYDDFCFSLNVSKLQPSVRLFLIY